MKLALLLTLLLGLCSCTSKTTSEQSLPPEPEALSFSARPLYSKPAEPAALHKSDSIISAIRSKDDLSEDDYVEIGKQLVATARYKKAVEVYTEGLKEFPDSYKLLRNRGHRFITLRLLERAIIDLGRAQQLISGAPDIMEYGLDGKPTATVRHQIHYHIGVYYYLKRQYAKSAEAFEKAFSTAGDSKNVVGTSDWLYNCYVRLGKYKKAVELISVITPTMDTDRENPYFRRILLYRGLITPEELIDITMAPDKMTVQDVTKLYGLGSWYKMSGERDKARSTFLLILASNAWPGFAYAAAEIEGAE